MYLYQPWSITYTQLMTQLMTHNITAIIATKTESAHQPPIFTLKTTNKIKDHNFMSLAYITHIWILQLC